MINPNLYLQCCQPAQNLPRSQFLFHKNGSLHDFYTMTLVMSGSKLVSFLRIKMLLPATTATISPLIYNECLSLRNTTISKVRECVKLKQFSFIFKKTQDIVKFLWLSLQFVENPREIIWCKNSNFFLKGKEKKLFHIL